MAPIYTDGNVASKQTCLLELPKVSLRTVILRQLKQFGRHVVSRLGQRACAGMVEMRTGVGTSRSASEAVLFKTDKGRFRMASRYGCHLAEIRGSIRPQSILCGSWWLLVAQSLLFHSRTATSASRMTTIIGPSIGIPFIWIPYLIGALFFLSYFQKEYYALNFRASLLPLNPWSLGDWKVIYRLVTMN